MRIAANRALARVAAAIATVESEGLLQQGREVAEYLMARLFSVRESCPEIESVECVGTFLPHHVRGAARGRANPSRECASAVSLLGWTRQGGWPSMPPLPLRIAEADVITGALRGSLLDCPW